MTVAEDQMQAGVRDEFGNARKCVDEISKALTQSRSPICENEEVAWGEAAGRPYGAGIDGTGPRRRIEAAGDRANRLSRSAEIRSKATGRILRDTDIRIVWECEDQTFERIEDRGAEDRRVAERSPLADPQFGDGQDDGFAREPSDE